MDEHIVTFFEAAAEHESLKGLERGLVGGKSQRRSVKFWPTSEKIFRNAGTLYPAQTTWLRF